MALSAPRSSPALHTSLTLPFAAIGLVGGGLASRLLSSEAMGSQANELHVLLLVITPAVAAGLGRALTPHGRARPLAAAAIACVGICAAGLLNGILVGLIGAGLIGLLVGAFFGLVCAIPFLPALLPVLAAARRVGRARAGSLVDGSDRRAVWLVTAVVASLASRFAPLFAAGRPRSPGLGLGVPILAAALIALFLALDLRARVGLSPPRGAPRAGKGSEAQVVDLGLGGEEVEELAPEGPTYRERERVLRVVRGDPARARAALGWAIAAELAGLVVTLLVLTAHLKA